MGKARIIILLVAILAGAGAFFLVNSSPSGAEKITQVVPMPVESDTVRVLIASKDFPQGAVLEPKKTKWINWPKSSVPDYYITEDDDAFVDGLPQMRARREILANEPIYADNTVRHGEGGMLAAIMTPGMRAVTARVSAEQASGGFVLPGDRVDVYVSGDVEAANGEDESFAGLLFSNVRVVAIDQLIATEDDENAITARTVTLELTPAQVEVFLLAREDQTLTIVLRSIFEGDVTPIVDVPRPDDVIVLRYGQG